MIRFTVDQYGKIRRWVGEEYILVPQVEGDPLYEEQQEWRKTNDMQLEYSNYALSLPDYKIEKKKELASFLDNFVDQLTNQVGIPKSEVSNFASKAQDAINYRYHNTPIPPYSPIIHEIGDENNPGTGESIEDLVDAIIMRVNQKSFVEGKAPFIRRTAGWAIDAATTHELVDAAVAGKIAELYEIFSRMNL